MNKIKENPVTSFETDLNDIRYTNKLFVELLYNLSKYPHPERPKRLVREGQFAFERENVFRASKVKK